MEQQEETSQHFGGIYNYFEGATIHNLVINGNLLFGCRDSTGYHCRERERATAFAEASFCGHYLCLAKYGMAEEVCYVLYENQ